MVDLNLKRCPAGWRPPCCCYALADTPNEMCHTHGYPNDTKCAFCGCFKRYRKPCSRCGFGRKAKVKS